MSFFITVALNVVPKFQKTPLEDPYGSTALPSDVCFVSLYANFDCSMCEMLIMES